MSLIGGARTSRWQNGKESRRHGQRDERGAPNSRGAGWQAQAPLLVLKTLPMVSLSQQQSALSTQHTESASVYAAAPAPASVWGVPSPRGWRYCAALPPPCHSSLLFVSRYYLCSFDHFYACLERERERESSRIVIPPPPRCIAFWFDADVSLGLHCNQNGRFSTTWRASVTEVLNSALNAFMSG